MSWKTELIELIARLVSRQDVHYSHIKGIEERIAQASSIMFEHEKKIEQLEEKCRNSQ